LSIVIGLGLFSSFAPKAKRWEHCNLGYQARMKIMNTRWFGDESNCPDFWKAFFYNELLVVVPAESGTTDRDATRRSRGAFRPSFASVFTLFKS
jgi:hypothetical protein